MPAKKQNQQSESKRFYIICAAATLAVLAVVFALIMHAKAQVPAYVMEVDGLNAETPAVAQAELRSDYKHFEKCMAEYEGCSWVWGGGNKLYLCDPDMLKINTDDDTANFTAVKFRDEHGNKLKGYIIDPAMQPKELGRIQIVNSEKYTYDNVSMSVRVGLRNGEISYDDAVYLWEKGSDEVLVVRKNTYDVVEGRIVSFTDDGNATHTCYILDTKI